MPTPAVRRGRRVARRAAAGAARLARQAARPAAAGRFRLGRDTASGGASGKGSSGGSSTGGAGVGGGAGAGATQGSGPPPAPRLIAPLSTATVTSKRPTLRWVLAGGTDGAHVEICRDRACTMTITAFDADGANGAPPDPLPSGVLFWRVFGRRVDTTGTTPSATWEMTVGARSAPIVASWGTTPDVNGDGFADVLVGAVGGGYGDAGRAYVYLGGQGGPAQSPATILTGDAPGRYFGGSVASAGDVNGDGFADVVIGSVGASGGSGQMYLHLGGATGLASSPATTITGNDGFTSNFGGSVASAGDVNGDGYADVVVGAYSAAAGGRAYLFLGGATVCLPHPPRRSPDRTAATGNSAGRSPVPVTSTPTALPTSSSAPEGSVTSPGEPTCISAAPPGSGRPPAPCWRLPTAWPDSSETP